MANFKKSIIIGESKPRKYSAVIDIKLDNYPEEPTFSASASIFVGKEWESSGQYIDNIAELVDGALDSPLYLEIRDLWEKYHLNDLNAGCEHQRKNWDENKEIILPHSYRKNETEKKTARWVYPKDHPDGLLTKPCEICGYRYGTDWVYAPIPKADLDRILALFD